MCSHAPPPFLLFNFLMGNFLRGVKVQAVHWWPHLFQFNIVPDSWSLSFFSSESESSFIESQESLLDKMGKKRKKGNSKSKLLLCLRNNYFFDLPPSTVFDSFFLRYFLSSSALTRYLSYWDLTNALALSPWTSSKNENNN